MKVEWKKGFNPDIVVERISKIRKLEGESVSYRGFEYREYMSVLISMIHFSPQLPQEVAARIARSGFRAAAKRPQLTASSVLRSVRRSLNEYMLKKAESYWLVTTMNINQGVSLPDLRMNGCTMKFYQQVPRKFVRARLDVLKKAAQSQIVTEDSSRCVLVVHCADKSSHGAVERMLEAVDILRGLLNMYLNSPMRISLGGSRGPINTIRLGPVHTLHDKSGGSSGEEYWYEPDYYKSNFGHYSKVQFDKAVDFVARTRNIMRRSKYRKDLEIAIIRYVRALDPLDHQSAFLRIWSVLEFITGTSDREGYEATIRRTAFHYKDPSYVTQSLEQLRQYRNSSVHLGTSDSHIEQYVYRVKGYVEQVMSFHIASRGKFASLRDAALFMDLSTDVDAIRNKIALLRLGLKFRSGS